MIDRLICAFHATFARASRYFGFSRLQRFWRERPSSNIFYERTSAESGVERQIRNKIFFIACFFFALTRLQWSCFVWQRQWRPWKWPGSSTGYFDYYLHKSVGLWSTVKTMAELLAQCSTTSRLRSHILNKHKGNIFNVSCCCNIECGKYTGGSLLDRISGHAVHLA